MKEVTEKANTVISKKVEKIKMLKRQTSILAEKIERFEKSDHTEVPTKNLAEN